METKSEVQTISSIEKYQELVFQVAETKKPVKVLFIGDIAYFEKIDSKGVKIIVGIEYDEIKPII